MGLWIISYGESAIEAATKTSKQVGYKKYYQANLTLKI